MEVTVEKRAKYVYVMPAGKVDSNTAPDFESALGGNMEDSGCCIIDFQSVPYITSAGIRVVMVAAKRSSIAGGRLILCGMNEVVRNIFDISGFSKILAIFPDIAGAAKTLE